MTTDRRRPGGCRASVPLALALLFAASTEAAITYRVRRDSNAALARATGSRVTIAGDDICIEGDKGPPDEPVTSNALVSRDGGASFIAINHENQTWFPAEGPPLTVVAGHCGMSMKEAKISKVKWLFTEPESYHYVAALAYTITERFDGVKIEVTCTAALDIRTTDAHPRELWPVATLFATQLPSVDERIAGDLASIKGFPVRIALTTGRQFKGGALYQSKSTLVTEDVRTVPDGAVPACKRPASYREQKPVIGVPGGT